MSLSLSQVLPHDLASRGKAFGPELRLAPEWTRVDLSYFSAPGEWVPLRHPPPRHRLEGGFSSNLPSPIAGAMDYPLSPSEKLFPGSWLPPVTIVFVMAEEGRNYVVHNWKEAGQVHAELCALIGNILRELGDGYMIKCNAGDLKYMLAFKRPEAALAWCLVGSGGGKRKP